MNPKCRKYVFVTASRSAGGGGGAMYLEQHGGYEGRSLPFKATSHVTMKHSSMTIQAQGGVSCSERYKFNKFQIFDGTSHGAFVLSHGSIDSITGQYSLSTHGFTLDRG